jgi:hypothetical protein
MLPICACTDATDAANAAVSSATPIVTDPSAIIFLLSFFSADPHARLGTADPSAEIVVFDLRRIRSAEAYHPHELRFGGQIPQKFHELPEMQTSLRFAQIYSVDLQKRRIDPSGIRRKVEYRL